MALPLEDYALIGDTQTAALVGRDGAIDWLCLPRFDSDACFAALLGTERHGRWRLAPVERPVRTTWRYRPETLILETLHALPGGAVLRVVDCMPPRRTDPDLIRIATAESGRVALRMELAPRFGYGATTPWLRPRPGGATLVAGPDALRLWTDAPLRLDVDRVEAALELDAGASIAFRLAWHPSHEREPPTADPPGEVERCARFWGRWVGACDRGSPWDEARITSLYGSSATTRRPSRTWPW